MEHAHIIATDTLVLVRATLPNATITDVEITEDAIHITATVQEHTVVSTIPLHVDVDTTDAIVVCDNEHLTVIVPRGDMR